MCMMVMCTIVSHVLDYMYMFQLTFNEIVYIHMYMYTYLFLVVVLEGVLIAFLESGKSEVDFCCPPDLSACQSNLEVGQKVDDGSMHDFQPAKDDHAK